MAIIWLRVALALYGLGLVYVLVALTRTKELLNRLALHAAYLGMVVVAALRFGSIIWKWNLPRFELQEAGASHGPNKAI